MGTQPSQKRPWLAAGLGLLVTGLGQAYLRRWLRAAGWLALAMLIGGLFVPTSAITDPGGASFWDIAPVSIVGGLSMLDAYLLARRHNARTPVVESDGETVDDPYTSDDSHAPDDPHTPVDPHASETVARCPACNRELDPEISFCQWCATEQTDSTA
ncbi:zinc ribbon domain-containing protein [Halobacteria archaeon AArc-dxtr1]|nr:zinc ribbon domain-containing protein [Halobacteria archaeon AArc-dxtr1]